MPRTTEQAREYYREHKDRINETRRNNPNSKNWTKNWQQAHPEKCKEYGRKARAKRKDKVREYDLMLHHGMTIDDYNKMLEMQGRGCAICTKQNTNRKKYLCVDHDHVTGKIRGLLCDACNRGLGFLGDTLEAIESAHRYLEENG